MTKEALDRIKEAYYSGLKVQIWFDGHWKNFDVRDYPINTDPFSEHRMYRIVGSAYVDIAEKQIADLKKENAELEAQIEKMSNVILELLYFEDNLDPYMYECNDAQQGELLKPFNDARELLKKNECKKCKGAGFIYTKKYHIKTTCPVCNGECFIFRTKE